MKGLKGWIGEAKLRLAMWLFLGSKYKVFTNVTIKLPHNKTSQIDHVIVSPHGIFVIETKNYKGLIRPQGQSNYWQQVLGRRSFSFYSPIKQNNGHISALKFMLKNKHYPYHNIVCFVGEAKFDGVAPDGVSVGIFGAIRLIRAYKVKSIKKQEVVGIAHTINQRRMPNNWRTKRLHIKNVKAKQSNRS